MKIDTICRVLNLWQKQHEHSHQFMLDKWHFRNGHNKMVINSSGFAKLIAISYKLMTISPISRNHLTQQLMLISVMSLLLDCAFSLKFRLPFVVDNFYQNHWLSIGPPVIQSDRGYSDASRLIQFNLCPLNAHLNWALSLVGVWE